MKKALLTALAIVVSITLGAGLAYADGNAFRPDPIPGSDTIISGCVIRFPTARTGQPEVHANGAHTCAGVKSVGIAKNGRLRINQTKGHSQKYPILFTVAQVDETLAARGIIAGPTGGNNHTEIQFYSTKLNRPLNLKKKKDRMVIAGNASNLWVGWVKVNNR